MPNAGHIILPLNFHPFGCQQYAEAMVDDLQSSLDFSPAKQAGNWLIIGGSGGFGCAARAVLGTCFGVDTLSISLDAKPQPENHFRQLGSAGFHRDLGITRRLQAIGRRAYSINSDAFTPETRNLAIAAIRQHFAGKINGLVWALATSRGFDARTGRFVSTALKPLKDPAKIKTFTCLTPDEPIRIVEPIIAPGTPEEAIQTQYVMGGQLVEQWLKELMQAEALAPGFTLLTLSYRGSSLTEALYRNGLIGLAKADLEFHTNALHHCLQTHCGGRAAAVEAPAIVTEASGGIPGVSLYLALLMDVMQETFADPVAVMLRLFTEKCSPINPNIFACDKDGLIRLDDQELNPSVVSQMALRLNQYQAGDKFETKLYTNFIQKYQQIRGFRPSI